MKAILIDASSVDVDVETFRPNEESFDVFCEFRVGVDDGSPGAELFYVQVTSPAWLQQQTFNRGKAVSGAHRIITDGWNWAAIVETLRRQVEACEGAGWTALWPQLCAIGRPADDYRAN